ncbi:hypothetical protein [Streptomyces sp. SS8]
MARTRIGVGLDGEHAERVRAHAERTGMGISAHLVNAAARQMAETEAMEARFSRAVPFSGRRAGVPGAPREESAAEACHA